MKKILIFNTMTFCIVGFEIGLLAAFYVGFRTHLHVFSIASVVGCLVGIMGLNLNKYIFKKYQLNTKLKTHYKFLLRILSFVVTLISFWTYLCLILTGTLPWLRLRC